MDADLHLVRQWMNEHDKQLLALAECVHKLMGAAGVRCEDHGIDRGEWDALRDRLDELFEFQLGFS
ncbi:hypothetical protein H4CHR_02952 [Variovorax sp. PBS-H4]|uniref:hypothetical protein n=1 Tax=Variovorax sp. PBS-H4 TaxID=434008 RepID=UPI0013164978|nr:hypothetical protein [Variovorax sp. PBS-H4]VTU32148.1 hypothetical protein H4CHR_02952 [Variovorax sp. PBS-H4]